MLGKLIKHEWIAVAKILGILHLALIAMAIVGRILLSIDALEEESMMWVMLLMVYVFSIMAVSIGSQLFLAMRFYKNMYTDQGYLTFTLPLKPWEHIWGKLLVAAAWVLIDYVVIIGSVFILVMNKEIWSEMIPALKELVVELEVYGALQVVSILLIIAIVILSLFSAPLLYYFSISIGQLFRSHKLLASVVTYFITVNVIQVISTIINFVYTVSSVDIVLSDASGNFENYYIGSLVLAFLAIFAMCAIAWSVTQFIMSRKLNLE